MRRVASVRPCILYSPDKTASFWPSILVFASVCRLHLYSTWRTIFEGRRCTWKIVRRRADGDECVHRLARLPAVPRFRQHWETKFAMKILRRCLFISGTWRLFILQPLQGTQDSHRAISPSLLRAHLFLWLLLRSSSFEGSWFTLCFVSTLATDSECTPTSNVHYPPTILHVGRNSYTSVVILGKL